MLILSFTCIFEAESIFKVTKHQLNGKPIRYSQEPQIVYFLPLINKDVDLEPKFCDGSLSRRVRFRSREAAQKEKEIMRKLRDWYDVIFFQSIIVKLYKTMINYRHVLKRTLNCTDYFANIVDSVAAARNPTEEELETPLAFGIVIHHQVGIIFGLAFYIADTMLYRIMS